jgi:hypothetical protein
MKAVLFNVKTWLIIGVLAIGVAILVAGEPNQATHDDKQTARQGNVNDTPHWYSAFKRPEWLSLIATFGRSRPAADASREVVERWLLDGL